MKVLIGISKASKTLIRDISELPSSVHEVVSNDDLLIEILLRLPAFSILLFKSVSKRWLSLITEPSFTLRRSQTLICEPPSGLFLKQPRPFSRSPVPQLELSFKYNFVPLDMIRIPHNITSFPFGSSDKRNVEILQSCNGLLLCCIQPGENYHVYNPFINHFKRIPPCHHYSKYSCIGGMRLAFDPVKSPHYKIVYARCRSHVRIQTYSSETGNWSFCGDRFPFQSFRGFHNGVYWNGAICWLRSTCTYFHLKLDVDNPLLTDVSTPVTCLGEKAHHDHNLFESGGCLLLVCTFTTINPHSQQLNVYEKRSGYSKWSMKYLVNVDDITRNIEGSPTSFPWYCISVTCVVVREKEEDSFLVMQFSGQVVQYKFTLKTLRELRLFDLGSSPSSFMSPASCFPFIASFASM